MQQNSDEPTIPEQHAFLQKGLKVGAPWRLQHYPTCQTNQTKYLIQSTGSCLSLTTIFSGDGALLIHVYTADDDDEDANSCFNVCLVSCIGSSPGCDFPGKVKADMGHLGNLLSVYAIVPPPSSLSLSVTSLIIQVLRLTGVFVYVLYKTGPDIWLLWGTFNPGLSHWFVQRHQL